MTFLAQVGVATATTVAFLSLAAAVRAQVPPAPRPGQAAPAGPLSTWRLGLSADAQWYENAQFVAQGQDSTWSTGGRASLDYARRFRTGAFGAGAYAGAIYYPDDAAGNDQATYGASLGLNVAPSPRTSITLGQTFARTNTRQLPVGTPDVPLPTTGVYYLDSTFGVSHGLAQSWQTSFSSSLFLRRYDDPAFVDGESLGAGLELSRGLGKASSAYASYQFNNEWFGGGQASANQLLVGVRNQPTRGVTLEASGGVAYLQPSDAWYPAGGASVSATGRHTSASVRYERDFGQAYGYGRQTIGDLAGATASWTPRPRLSFSVDYTFSHRRDSADLDYQIRSHVFGGGVAWGAPKGFSASARYSWERNQTEGFPVYEGSRVMASISYGVEWR